MDRRKHDLFRCVCVGAIVGPHGTQGSVRIKSFTQDPAAIGRYGGLCDDRGLPVSVTVQKVRRDVLIAAIDGITDRTAAAALKGSRLHVPRANLPSLDDNEFYHADLVGLAVERTDGRMLGTVDAVYDFGAGDVIEIATGKGSVVLPFTHGVVPLVDLAGGRLVVDPPPGLPGLEQGDDVGSPRAS